MADTFLPTEKELDKQKLVFFEIVKELDSIEAKIVNASSDAELTTQEAELKNADTRLGQLLSVMPSVPCSNFVNPIQKDFRGIIDAILSASVRIITLRQN